MEARGEQKMCRCAEFTTVLLCTVGAPKWWVCTPSNAGVLGLYLLTAAQRMCFCTSSALGTSGMAVFLKLFNRLYHGMNTFIFLYNSLLQIDSIIVFRTMVNV